MTQQTSGRPPAPAEPSATRIARDEAAEVGHSTAEASQRVAGTAVDQAGEVAREARRQAKDLFGEARQQATEQARVGQQQAAEGLRALAGELHQMADGGDQHGPVSDLAKQAAGTADDIAGWLDRHEPGDLLGEVRAMARRRPGAFLVGAAVAGVLAGRLTRGAVDANRDTGSRHPDGATPVEPIRYPTPDPLPGYPAPPPPPMPYDPVAPAGAMPPGGPIDAPSGYPPPPQNQAPQNQAPQNQAPRYQDPAQAHYERAPYRQPDRRQPAQPGYAQSHTGSQYPQTEDPQTELPQPGQAGPAHGPRTGATTVGEYVEELERRNTRADNRTDPGGRA